jgi:hypothetical protein
LHQADAWHSTLAAPIRIALRIALPIAAFTPPREPAGLRPGGFFVFSFFRGECEKGKSGGGKGKDQVFDIIDLFIYDGLTLTYFRFHAPDNEHEKKRKNS